ncbi:MAG: OmpA family protein, partial [Ignavibacterium sp.]
GLSESFALKTEAVYHTASNNKIDGNDRFNENSKGFFGGNGDTYGRFDLGILWYFSKGDVSDLCDKCPEGLREIYYRDSIIIKEPYEIIRYQKDTVKIKEPVLFNVHFDFDKYTLRPESYPILDQAVKTLNEFKDVQVVISGHTDSFGSDEYNEKLSQRRVETVYNYLISKGVNPNRISKSWFGEKQPIRSNDSDINRAFNRRVEIKISN